MSRQLPARPNLEHLKKQAKDLLPALQRRDPAAQLADAQHALAREYGFASWPKLKTHVELQAATAAIAASPFAGVWKANIAESTPHPANVFASATIQFDIVGDVVRITDVVVDAAGREERRVNIIRADGRDHLSEGGHGYSLRATWRHARLLETVATQHGHVVGTGSYEVAADDTTLTIAADQQRIVLDRVRS